MEIVHVLCSNPNSAPSFLLDAPTKGHINVALAQQGTSASSTPIITATISSLHLHPHAGIAYTGHAYHLVHIVDGFKA
jgi:hypothetical protein